MTGQQICLKWNSFQANILTSFESLWEEEGLVDVTLASDGECIRAHKVILSACSPFFKRLFQTNPCQHPVIILQDVHFSELESLLSFVYKGEVNIDQDNLPALLRAAETLQIRGLSGASEQLKEKMGLSKNSSSVPTHQTPRDGSPPYKRRRSVQPPRSPALPTTPVASIPTSLPDYSKHPSSSSTDPSEPNEPTMMMHKIEARSSESGSPVPLSLSVEDAFEESVDESIDLKASQVSETEQLKETSIQSENDDKLRVGATFSTFHEFEDAFEEWTEAGHHPMCRFKSNRNRNPLQAENHPFMTIQYVCKHHGTPRSRGNNIRPNQRYFSRECPVHLTVGLMLRSMKYKVKHFFAEHNHPVSAELRAQYPDRRMKLDKHVKETITQFLRDNVKPKHITSYFASNFSKTITAKDIHNMKRNQNLSTRKDTLTALGNIQAVIKKAQVPVSKGTTRIGSRVDDDMESMAVVQVEDNFEPLLVYNVIESDATDGNNLVSELVFDSLNDGSSISTPIYHVEEDNTKCEPAFEVRRKMIKKVCSSVLPSSNSAPVPSSSHIEEIDFECKPVHAQKKGKMVKVYPSVLQRKKNGPGNTTLVPSFCVERIETVSTESEDIVTVAEKRTMNNSIFRKK